MQWRPMTDNDVAAVIKLAAIIHLDHPEDDAVLAERYHLFPPACLMLENPIFENPAGVAGYTLAHPCAFEKPPALNALMGGLPARADCLHIHDIALLPAARGTGAARTAIEKIARTGYDHGYRRLSIVAVNSTEPFWEKCGFTAHASPALNQKLASYDGPASYMIRQL